MNWTLIIVALISMVSSVVAAVISRSTHKAVNSRVDLFKADFKAEYEERLKRLEGVAFQAGMAQQRKDDTA